MLPVLSASLSAIRETIVRKHNFSSDGMRGNASVIVRVVLTRLKNAKSAKSN